MAGTYTTPALVRKRNSNIPSDITDADIEQFIIEVEGTIDATMKHSFISTFNSIDHSLIRSAATPLATLAALPYDPGTAFLELEDAKATTELLTAEADRALNLLADPRTVAYMKSRGDLQTMQKVSTTTVDFSATGQTTLYTVPAGQIFIPTMAVIRAGSDAAETDATFGRVGALTDWLGTTQLDNLDADGDQIKVEQTNANPPTQAKTYAAGTIFQIDVTVAAGGATNYVDLFGYLIGA